MSNENLKSMYQSLKSETVNTDIERIRLGIREIDTLKMLAKEVDFQTNGIKSFLDVGCGDKYLQQACHESGWNYLGIDYSDANFEFDTFPVNDASFDIICSLAVIEHLTNPDNFLNEVFRCLKPGGLLYLSTPNFQLDFINFYNDPTHVHPYTPISLELLLQLKNFRNVHIFPGLRCKNISWYRGKYRFLKAYLLLPFRNDAPSFIPDFLKGHSRSIFALATKPLN